MPYTSWEPSWIGSTARVSFPKSLNPGCRCDGNVRAMRDDVPEATVASGEGQGPDVLATMQGDSQGSRVGDVWASGAEGTDTGELRQGRDEGQGKPSLEGRRDVLAQEGQLSGDQVRTSSDVGVADGAERRLRDGAPAVDGADGRATTGESGVRPSPRSRSAEQRADESGAVADERGSQAWGGWPLCPRCGLPVGLGTALKPSHEPVVVARKPLAGTVAGNVLEHGTGALNVDGCRIGGPPPSVPQPALNSPTGNVYGFQTGHGRNGEMSSASGRWPANVVLSHHEDCEQVGTRRVKTGTHMGQNLDPTQAPERRAYGTYRKDAANKGHADADGMEEIPAWRCVESCPVRLLDEQSGTLDSGPRTPIRNAQARPEQVSKGAERARTGPMPRYTDPGGASRFFATFSQGGQREMRECQAEGCPYLAADGLRFCRHHDEPPESRFMYTAKASSAERNAGLEGFEEREVWRTTGEGLGLRREPGSLSSTDEPTQRKPARNGHPTVKPIALMRWLVRLVTPPGGTVLDCFAGSGTTGIAASLEGFNFVGIEREEEYVRIAEARIKWWGEHPEGMEITKSLEADRKRRAVADSGQLGFLD
jgi:hypothetical protein